MTLAGLWLILLVLARSHGRDEIRNLKGLGGLLVAHLALGLGSVNGMDGGPHGFAVMQFLTRLTGIMVGVGLFNALVLGITLGRFQRAVPTILRSVFGVLAVVIGTIVLLDKQGFDVKSLLPTGAVLTAVVGLALQKTLGNLIAGLSIQVDKSVRVGDWISLDNLYGRVSAIRWRSSTLETNDFEAIIVPNAQLLDARLLVRGRRHGEPSPWRRWVKFRIDFDAAPAEVSRLALDAITREALAGVALDPPPDCLLQSLEEGVAVYALRYYLDDFTRDEATDATVRLRLLYALRRAGYEPALPSSQLKVSEAGAEALQAESAAHRKGRLGAREAALKSMELFSHLEASEIENLARQLKDAPFATGEALCRQGEAADSLYLVVRGRVGVSVAANGAEQEIAQLGPGQFFGEMGLMTGEKRNATVRALGHVDAYRLDKEAFRQLLSARPEVAETLAEALAKRRAGREQSLETLDLAAREHRRVEQRKVLTVRICEFFGLGPSA